MFRYIPEKKYVFLLMLALIFAKEGWSMQEESLDEPKNSKVIRLQIIPKIDSPSVIKENDIKENQQNKDINQKIMVGVVGLLGGSVTFTLEVLGATGAFWGATDVLGLHNKANDYQFRVIALGIGALALIRYAVVHALNPNKYQSYLKDIDQASCLEGICRAFEYPIPALKTSAASLFYKLRRK